MHQSDEIFSESCRQVKNIENKLAAFGHGLNRKTGEIFKTTVDNEIQSNGPESKEAH